MKQLLKTDDARHTSNDGHPTIKIAHHEPMAQVAKK